VEAGPGGLGNGRSMGSGERISPLPQKLEQFAGFPVEELGFNEYSSRLWTPYLPNAHFIKKFLKIQWGRLTPPPTPLWVCQWWKAN